MGLEMMCFGDFYLIQYELTHLPEPRERLQGAKA